MKTMNALLCFSLATSVIAGCEPGTSENNPAGRGDHIAAEQHTYNPEAGRVNAGLGEISCAATITSDGNGKLKIHVTMQPPEVQDVWTEYNISSTAAPIKGRAPGTEHTIDGSKLGRHRSGHITVQYPWDTRSSGAACNGGRRLTIQEATLK